MISGTYILAGALLIITAVLFKNGARLRRGQCRIPDRHRGLPA
jgi:hypothetical protein